MDTDSMDKRWMFELDTFSESYKDGVSKFLKLAKDHVKAENKLIPCPCNFCNNTRSKSFDAVKKDLHMNGFSPNYTEWIFHGEKANICEGAYRTAGEKDVRQGGNDGLDDMLSDMAEAQPKEGVPESFIRLCEMAERELYPGSGKSLLEVVVKLLHIKVQNKWSDKSFDMLLTFLKEILPEGYELPTSYYSCKKILDEMGLGYNEIHVCKNDCALFYKENKDLENCPVCKESRWKSDDGKGRKIPHKVLRHFPLKDRLQKKYMFRQTAADMRWHKEKRKDEEGIMRHPADSPAWKHFDNLYPDFAKDPRNVRLGLATDGFTPWSNLGNSYSMWPVILVPYNLPSYQFMKEEFLMMTLLIPGPRSPGKDIDVFLRPVVDECLELWDGVETYDVHSQETFKLRASIFLTISDFPGYGSISGWVTSGKMACPCCFDQTRSKQIRSKTSFMGHRCFLAKNHAWRKNKKSFNGEVERRPQPSDLSGEEVLEWLNRIFHLFEESGKAPKEKGKKRKRSMEQGNWVKRSIFFELPYWKYLLIRHCLDVMHIEKNICDNILGTLLSIKGKTKDTEKAREDLRDWGIREELHMKVRASDNKPVKPVAAYTLSSKEKDGFLEFLKSVTFPDAFAANISSCVKDKNIYGLKSHDCHVLLQRLIPAGMRGYLNKEINDALYELGDFFKELCSKTLKVEDIEKLERNIPLVLCKLEKIFPPAFFTVMVHLSVHLPREAKIAGPVQPRWMYPIERNLGSLKDFVRNRARPEASIAQGYIVKESLTFMSMYLTGIETKFNKQSRNYDGTLGEKVDDLSVFSMRVRPFGPVKNNAVDCGRFLGHEDLEKAHLFLLGSCKEVEEYLKIFKAEVLGVSLQEAGDLEVNDSEMKQFPRWFQKYVNGLRRERPDEVTDGLWAIANGPIFLETKYFTACMVNEVRFHTKDREARRRTQNSGLVVEGEHKKKMIEFFGFLNGVVQLSYLGNRKAVLFQCEWFDMGSRKTVQDDKHFISIDVRSRWYKQDPFVLPIQVKQVFYIDDTKLGKNWKIVQRVHHRHLWDLPDCEGEAEYVINHREQMPMQQDESEGVVDVGEDDVDGVSNGLVRTDLEPVEIDAQEFHKLRQEKISDIEEESDDDNDYAFATEELDYFARENSVIDCDEGNTSEDETMGNGESDDDDDDFPL